MKLKDDLGAAPGTKKLSKHRDASIALLHALSASTDDAGSVFKLLDMGSDVYERLKAMATSAELSGKAKSVKKGRDKVAGPLAQAAHATKEILSSVPCAFADGENFMLLMADSDKDAGVDKLAKRQTKLEHMMHKAEKMLETCTVAFLY